METLLLSMVTMKLDPNKERELTERGSGGGREGKRMIG
jgi:hypothetical protein